MPEENMYHFLAEPPLTDQVNRMFDEDLEDDGYVMNLTRLWAYGPEAKKGLFETLGTVTRLGELSLRQRGILVSACASTLGDAYCSLAWGARLANAADPEAAAGVLTGDDSGLDPAEQVMARWARRVARDPTGTSQSDVGELRAAGFTDREIFAMTVYVALRLAFSTVNNALGARPDRELAEAAPGAVRDAVAYGRPVAADRSGSG